MHELGIAAEIYRSARLATGGCPPGRLEAVRVAVGERSAVEPSLLRSAWDAVIAGGCDEGARLQIEWHPSRQFCVRCGEPKPRGLGSWLSLCPDCGFPLRVEGGDELDLLQVAYETEAVS